MMDATDVEQSAPTGLTTSEAARLSPDERAARGRAARKTAPRTGHGEWAPARDRPDPVSLLEEQAQLRVPELMPIRHGRMIDSPFRFFRGAAYVMASDLARTPKSGLRVQLCGDAHVGNFRGLASPERQLLFDLNDFDETLPGPWEWDLKRLAASLVIAGQDRGFARKRSRGMVRIAVTEYRDAIRRFARMSQLDIWYSKLDANTIAEEFRAHGTPKQVERLDRAIAKARRKDRSRAFEKLTSRVDGTPKIVANQRLRTPVEELFPDAEAPELDAWVDALLASYRSTLEGHRQHLFDRYTYAHFARKVVGVGSVGTRVWVALLLGRDDDDPLFLQLKEAQPSVLEPFAGKSRYNNMGRRVVEGARLIQAAGDSFLGWLRATGLDGQTHDYYVRQLWDWKGAPKLDRMPPSSFDIYAGLCGRTLARAHARSGDAIAISSYLGVGGAFVTAIERFAEAYAEQNERDYQALVAAVKSGRLAADTDV